MAAISSSAVHVWNRRILVLVRSPVLWMKKLLATYFLQFHSLDGHIPTGVPLRIVPMKVTSLAESSDPGNQGDLPCGLWTKNLEMKCFAAGAKAAVSSAWVEKGGRWGMVR